MIIRRITKLQVTGLLASIIMGLAYVALPQSPVASPAKIAIRGAPVEVGEMAPDFTLEDQQGRPVTLSSTRGKMPIVLVFYRGYW